MEDGRLARRAASAQNFCHPERKKPVRFANRLLQSKDLVLAGTTSGP